MQHICVRLATKKDGLESLIGNQARRRLSRTTNATLNKEQKG